MAHPIENILRTTMEQLKLIADVNTVVGAPIMTSDNTIVLPVCKISFGFISGGGEYGQQKSPLRKAGQAFEETESGYPFIGSSVVAVTMQPAAFLTVQNGHVSVLPADSDGTLDRIVDRIPQLVGEAERLIQNIGKKKESGEQAQ